MEEGEYFCSSNPGDGEGSAVEKCKEEFFTPASGGSFHFNLCSLSNYDKKIKANLGMLSKNPLFDWYQVENNNNILSGAATDDRPTLLRGRGECVFNSGVKKAKSFSASGVAIKQTGAEANTAINRCIRGKSLIYQGLLMDGKENELVCDNNDNNDNNDKVQNAEIDEESDFLLVNQTTTVKELARRSLSEGSLNVEAVVLAEPKNPNLQMIAESSIRPKKQTTGPAAGKGYSLHTSFSDASIMLSYKGWRNKMQENNKTILRKQSNNMYGAGENMTTIEASVANNANSKKRWKIKARLNESISKFVNRLKKPSKKDQTVVQKGKLIEIHTEDFDSNKNCNLNLVFGHDKINETIRKINKFHNSNGSETHMRELITGHTIKVCNNEDEQQCIPPFIVECVGQIEKRGLNSFGIYRVNGNKVCIDSIIECFHSNGENFADQVKNYNVNAFCGALKQYLRMLPTAVIPMSCFERLKKVYLNNVRVFADVKDVAALKRDLEVEFFTCLSRYQYATLKFLMRHLNKALRYEQETKMSCNNLALCIWLCLIERSGNDSVSMIGMGQDFLSFSIEIFIAHYKFIFDDSNNQ